MPIKLPSGKRVVGATVDKPKVARPLRKPVSRVVPKARGATKS